MHQIYSVCMCIKYVSRCPSILKELTDTHTYICVCVYIYMCTLHRQHVQVALQSSEVWLCLVLLSDLPEWLVALLLCLPSKPYMSF